MGFEVSPPCPPGPCSLSSCLYTQHLKRTCGPRRATRGAAQGAPGPRKERSEKRRELASHKASRSTVGLPQNLTRLGGGRLPPSGSISERLAARNRGETRQSPTEGACPGFGDVRHPPVGPGFLPEPSTPRGSGASVAPARPRGVGGLWRPRRRGSSARRRARRGPSRHGPGPSAARSAPGSRRAPGRPTPRAGLCARMWASPPGRPSPHPTPPPTPGPAPTREHGPRGKEPEGGPEGKMGAQSAEFVLRGRPCGAEECEATGAARALDGRGDDAGFRQGPPSPEAAPGVGSAKGHARWRTKGPPPSL